MKHPKNLSKNQRDWFKRLKTERTQVWFWDKWLNAHRKNHVKKYCPEGGKRPDISFTDYLMAHIDVGAKHMEEVEKILKGEK